MATAPYGAWESPISAEDVAAESLGLSFPRFAPAADGLAVWWTEGRPAEGGRQVVVRQRAGGEPVDALPAPWNARTRVHEYGGASWLPTADGLAFAEFTDQRLYLLAPGAGEPTPLSPAPAEPAGWRYAEPLQVGDELWCVREQHAQGEVTRALVAVPLDGSQQVRELVAGSDFLAGARVSPDGRRLAWLAWDHPRMPWDGTELRVADIAEDGSIGTPRTVLGGPAESVLQPEWADADALYALTDRSGWWNLVRVPAGGGEPAALHPKAEEFGAPAWSAGQTTYAVLGDGRIATVHGVGERALSVLDPQTGVLTTLDLPYRAWRPSVAAAGNRVLGIAAAPTLPWSVVSLDVAAPGRPQVHRRAAAAALDPGWLPVPSQEHFPGPDGRPVHALVYPPTNPQCTAPAGALAPYVVFVHGGPTSQVLPALDLEKAYFTSRGIGVLDVNYGGSTGYGRAYRELLRESWGVVDVADCVTAARGLADTGRADPARLAIRGGSAGGWTVLAALTGTDAFAAGASYFGVAELLRFAQDTHDFESRYLDGLIGPLPECRDRYVERAPLSHVEDLTCPVLLLQGAEDEVVPPSQAELFRDALARKGIPHAYLLFEGEQHGFRRSETIVAALEAELSFYGQVLGFDPPGVPRLALVVER